MLADLFVPGGTAAEREALTRFQREAADAESAARLYGLVYEYDARRAIEHIAAPALVLHRRKDTAVAFQLGRELAASLPDARLVALEGMRHLPWHGDSGAVISEALEFLAETEDPEAVAGHGPPVASAAAAESPPSSAAAGRSGLSGPMVLPELSPREVEVLRLVAEGQSDQQIAAQAARLELI